MKPVAVAVEVAAAEGVARRAVPAEHVGVEHADVLDAVGLDQPQAVAVGVDRVVGEAGLDAVLVDVPDQQAAVGQEEVVQAGVRPTVLAVRLRRRPGRG